jgi:hypothetical protein
MIDGFDAIIRAEHTTSESPCRERMVYVWKMITVPRPTFRVCLRSFLLTSGG